MSIQDVGIAHRRWAVAIDRWGFSDFRRNSKRYRLPGRPKIGALSEDKMAKKPTTPLPMTHRHYEKTLVKLQIELVKLQRHVIERGQRVLVILEGRDAAGKDGTIKRIIEHLSPRDTRVVALGPPTAREERSWYFQRYIPYLPSAGEIVLFNRSWYNRAGVERVMGFCTKAETEEFLETMLIRLLPMTANRGVLPVARVKFGIGRTGRLATNSEQRAEGVERVEAPVKAEGELVEVGLQMLRADAVMTALQPAFEVAENEVDDRQVFLGDLGIVALDHGKMLIADPAKPRVARGRVGDDHRARKHGALDEACQRQPAAIGRDFQAQPPSVATATARRGLNATLWRALADFDGGDHKRLIVNALTAAPRVAANPRLVNLNMAADCADLVAVRPHHPGPQLVENLERRLVAGQSELPLELRRAQPCRMAGDKVRGPKPHAQRRARVLHHRSRRQSDVATALPASQHLRTIGEAERLARRVAVRTGKPVFPPDLFEIGGARRIVGKESLEVGQRAREGKAGVLEDVGGHRSSPPKENSDHRMPPSGRRRLRLTPQIAAAHVHAGRLLSAKCGHGLVRSFNDDGVADIKIDAIEHFHHCLLNAVLALPFWRHQHNPMIQLAAGITQSDSECRRAIVHKILQWLTSLIARYPLNIGLVCVGVKRISMLETVPNLEALLIRSGITLLKYYLDISKAEQKRRLADRRRDPLSQWKLSPIDDKAPKLWHAYSKARDRMLERTSSAAAPWTVVRADDKQHARLNVIRDLLWRLDYPGRQHKLHRPDPLIISLYDPTCHERGLVAP
jgi:polyphosphate kinase 2 (PPK2 family)